MPFFRRQRKDDSNSRVAAFESMLDLFTVISFLLILAASLQVARTSSDKNWSSVVSEVAKSGGVAQALPKDVVLMVLYREDAAHRLSAIFGNSTERFNKIASEANIETLLEELSASFTKGTKIQIGIAEDRGPINAVIWMKMQVWLTKNGHNKFNVYYVDKS